MCQSKATILKFDSLDPLLRAVTKVALDRCLAVHMNWTSSWDGPSSEAPSTLMHSMSFLLSVRGLRNADFISETLSSISSVVLGFLETIQQL